MKIEPALRPEDWQNLADRAENPGLTWSLSRSYDTPAAACAAVIAEANHRLPADDPRKITRERLEGLRNALSSENNFADRTGEWTFLDALESYVPPEP